MARLVSSDASFDAPCSGRSLETIRAPPAEGAVVPPASGAVVPPASVAEGAAVSPELSVESSPQATPTTAGTIRALTLF